jgi:hypothetical protein
MTYDLKEINQEVFDTLDIELPPCNPIGLYFEYNNTRFKIIDAIFKANKPLKTKPYNPDTVIATLVVTTVNTN